MHKLVAYALPLCLVFAGTLACGEGFSLCSSGCSPAVAAWAGTSTLTSDGVSQSWDDKIVVEQLKDSVAGNVSGTCPGDGPTIPVTFSDREASWTGTAKCDPTPVSWCDAAVLQHEVVSVSVGADNLARINILGHASGCGREKVTYSMTMIGHAE